MVEYEDDCVGCPQGCINCGRRETPHWYCDECGEEFDPEDLYDVEGDMVCEECILSQYEKISI